MQAGDGVEKWKRLIERASEQAESAMLTKDLKEAMHRYQVAAKLYKEADATHSATWCQMKALDCHRALIEGRRR